MNPTDDYRHKHKPARSSSRGVSPDENDNSREKERKSHISSTTTTSHDELGAFKSNIEPLVYLNIGGYKYIVDRKTLCSVCSTSICVKLKYLFIY